MMSVCNVLDKDDEDDDDDDFKMGDIWKVEIGGRSCLTQSIQSSQAKHITTSSPLSSS